MKSLPTVVCTFATHTSQRSNQRLAKEHIPFRICTRLSARIKIACAQKLNKFELRGHIANA